MALSNVLLLSQIAGNAVAFVLSLCILVPLSLHVTEFNGKCLLFAHGQWGEDDGLFNVTWPSQMNCSFPIITAVVILMISMIQIYRFVRLSVKQEEASFLGLFLDVFFGFLLCLMTIVSAMIITMGFMDWCSDITLRFPSCEIAAGQNIIKEDQKIDTSGFYVQMGTAQFGAWGAFATCVVISVAALLKLINNHEMTNMRVSMYLERQRLVNEDASRDSLDTPGDFSH
ncbi:transmembrane protein 179 [Lutzomyia longipalpis]|nr:transmembrane protein 179 [Lutzomyia longipalpis]